MTQAGGDNVAFITMDFEGLEELQKQFETLADDKETVAVEKKIVTRCRDHAAERMKGKVPRSGNNAKSGKKGYRPSGHAADNVPVSNVRMSGGSPTATVGWEKADNSEYFYIKFVEWGTYRMQPRDFIYSTINECWAAFDGIAENEIQAFVDEKLG